MPATGEMLVVLDPDDVTPEMKTAIDQSGSRGMERLLYVALTRAKHTLVLASDGDLFKTARGEMQKASQMKWLRCDTGECNEAAFKNLGARRPAKVCAETEARQTLPASGREEEHVKKLPRIAPDLSRANAANFVRKANPSGLTAELQVLESSGEHSDDAMLYRAPANFDNAATRYGTWWHNLAQRIPWSVEIDSWNEIFETALSESPDPARSGREWKLLLEYFSGAANFRQRFSNSEVVAHAEMPFFGSSTRRRASRASSISFWPGHTTV